MNTTRAVLLALLAVLIASCSSGVSPASTTGASQAVSGAELQIYGAASLKSGLAAVKDAYESTHAGMTLTITTDSSAALATKIEQGAPVDVFLSADMSNPQKLVDEGLASASAGTKFAGNLLTVIVPAGNPAGLESAKDLARGGLKVIAAADTVPISKYAQQLVGNLAAESGYPANFEAAYGANVVSSEDNVAAIVSKVALGEGDAAIVYVTDAMTSSKVRTIDVPPNANVRVTYGGVVLKASQHPDAASQFLAWLSGPEGQTVLGTFGFRPAQ